MNKAIGIDIGGTKIYGGLIDEEGRVLKEYRRDTDARMGRDVILRNVFEVVDSLEPSYACGIGIGSAGRIDNESGIVVYATDNLPGWSGINLRKMVEERYGLPVEVENDVNAAALGEKWLGAARNAQNFVMLTIGTGLGGAVVIEDKLVRGKHFSAGEFGHVILYPGGRQCNCGLRGCAEQYISGTALYKRYNELSFKDKLNGAKEVFDLLSKKDLTARKVLDEFLDSLEIFMINLINSIDVEKYIFGGGLMASERIWWEVFLRRIQGKAWIERASLGEKATIFGAASLILKGGIEK